MTFLSPLLKGIILGLSLAAPPGPVNAIIANRSLIHWVLGSLVGIGALSADLIFLSIALVLGSIVPPNLIPYIGVIGGLLMLYLAFQVLFSNNKKNSTNNSKIEKKHGLWNYATGLMLGLTNPFQISWWITVGVVLVSSFGPFILFGFIIGILLWVFSFSITVYFGRRKTYIERSVRIISFLVLLVFSLYIIYHSIGKLSL